MQQTLSLSNQFLIAMPALHDPNFHKSVTYICEHTEEGAMGIVINHPLEIQLSDLLSHMDMPENEDNPLPISHRPILSGGPVQPERGFVLHHPDNGDWQSTLEISDEVEITTSRDILSAMAQGKGPKEALIALGYAGWEPGQLEQELKDNTWLNGPADTHILFNVPFAQRWRAATQLLGFNIDNLSGDIGHG